MATKKPSRRRRRDLLAVEQVSDRCEQYDRVQRIDGKLYLADTRGLFAPLEVRDDEAEQLPAFRENLKKLRTANEVNMARRAVACYPWISQEGKEARDALLSARWREIFGDELFVID